MDDKLKHYKQQVSSLITSMEHEGLDVEALRIAIEEVEFRLSTEVTMKKIPHSRSLSPLLKGAAMLFTQEKTGTSIGYIELKLKEGYEAAMAELQEIKQKKVMGSRIKGDEFKHFVLLNGEGCFVPECNRDSSGKVSPGSFTMYANDEAFELLTSYQAYMMADGRLEMRSGNAA